MGLHYFQITWPSPPLSKILRRLLDRIDTELSNRGGVEDTRLEAQDSLSEDRLSRGQGQECSRPRTKDTGASVLQKKGLEKIFSGDSEKGKQKRFSQIFREVSGVFLLNFKNEQIPTIVGTDANAHHTIWEFSKINFRGEDLLAYCVNADLNFCNVGNKPTFRTKTREEVLDLTLVNRCACDRVVGWHVSNVLSFLDHMYMRFQAEVGVSQNSSQVSQMRNLRCALCLFFSACAIYVCESVNLIFVAL